VQSWTKLVTLFLAGIATSSVSPACSIEFVPTSVRSSFKVKVSGYDGPVKGLQLNLTSPNAPGASAVTDGNGIASFDSVPEGTRYLKADHDSGYGQALEVKANGPANAVIPMGWPSEMPIHVRALSGIMRAPGVVPGEAEQPALSLELLDGISGRILSSIDTASHGEFDFGPRGQGIYFIHLKPYSALNSQIEGLISLAVDSAAQAGRLDLDLTWTSCGLEYIDQRQCPQSDLHVKKLEGHVSDPHGGPPVRTGVIVLLDAAQSQVALVSPDRDGNFSFPDPLVGRFELWIGRGGFSPVHAQLYIEPTAISSSLEVEAAYGTCSAVRAR